MSVRMAIVKLAALGAAGALIGGGAVHMAEQQKDGPPEYVKHAPTKVVRRVTRITTTRECPPGERTAALVPQSPPEEQPLPGPYYTTFSAHRHHHRHYYAPPPPPPPTPVPAPPMLVLFGAAASALMARRMLAKQKASMA